MNTTAKDFTHMAGIIEKLDPSFLQTSSYANVLDFALRQLRPYVADATTALTARQRNVSPGSTA